MVGEIFPPGDQLRSGARSFLIIHNEIRSIENAILLSADSGMLDAIVYNTYMTSTVIPDFVTTTVDPGTDIFHTTNNGFLTGDEIQFNTTDTLPLPLSVSQNYFAIHDDADHFKVANGYLDALNETALDITSAGIGTQSVRKVTPAQQFWQVWQGLRTDRAMVDQMNGVMKHFENLNYQIRRQTNPNVLDASVFWWRISW